jgi:hypothetical protein
MQAYRATKVDFTLCLSELCEIYPIVFRRVFRLDKVEHRYRIVFVEKSGRSAVW